MAHKKQVIVSLDEEQVEWLKQKEEEGYSRPGLIRYAVKRLMAESAMDKEKEPEAKISKEVEKERPEEPYKNVEIEKILEIIIKLAESGKFDLPEFPSAKIIDTAKAVQEQFKNIDYLPPKSAFELGKFKIEMENKFNDAMREHKTGKS